MDTKAFYESINQSLFAGKISTKQTQAIDQILAEYDKIALNDLRKLAYILATVYHETGHTMQPVEERGKGKGYDYGKKLKRGAGPGRRIPYTNPDQLYYGRGLVQLTWYENYQAMGKIAGIDLLNHPELMLNMEVSIDVLFDGMINGSFTGFKLSDFFNDKTTDFVNARKIINGTDQAERIAGYAERFYAALSLIK